MRLLVRFLLASFIASLVTKLLADFFLLTPIHLFGSWVLLDYTQNPGIAFGIRLPALLLPFVLTLAVVILLVVALRSRHTRLSSAAFGLILGGALANIVDRLFDSVVTDFIHVGSFPVFNVADSSITIGVVILLAEALWSKLRAPRTPPFQPIL